MNWTSPGWYDTGLAISDIRKLSVAERIQLVEDIWDSIAADADAVPLTDDQRSELDRRIADAEPGCWTAME